MHAVFLTLSSCGVVEDDGSDSAGDGSDGKGEMDGMLRGAGAGDDILVGESTYTSGSRDVRSVADAVAYPSTRHICIHPLHPSTHRQIS